MAKYKVTESSSGNIEEQLETSAGAVNATGTAEAATAVQVAGSDGTNTVILLTDATGALATTGSGDAEGTIGAAAPAIAVQVGAQDGAGDLQNLLVDGAGALSVTGGGDAEGTIGAAAPAIAVQMGARDGAGDMQNLLVDGAGALSVTGGGDAEGTPGAAVPAKTVASGGTDGVNLQTFNVGAGNAAAGTQRVVLASDDVLTAEILDTQIERYLELDRCTAIAGWSAILDAAAIATTINHVPHEDKMLSLTFNKAGGTNVLSGIQKTLASIDASAFEGQTLMTGRIYFTSLADVDYAFLRLGTDNSNYAEWRAGADLLTAGVFNHVQTEAHQLTSNVGTGCNFSAITYVAFGFATNLAADTLNGTILDYLNLLSLPSVNAAIGVDVIAGNTPASVRVQKFGTPSNANVTTDNGAASSGTLRVTLANDGTGLTNVTPPDPGGAETITATDGSDPAIGDMVAIALDTVVVTLSGILTADDGDTAIDMEVFARERDNVAIVSIATFEDMEVAGSESWVLKILPQPVGDAYDAIGIRFDSVGANTPTYTNKLRQRK